jgi:hypothetical protein
MRRHRTRQTGRAEEWPRQAVRFTTLAALCDALDSQPGDLLRWETADSSWAVHVACAVSGMSAPDYAGSIGRLRQCCLTDMSLVRQVVPSGPASGADWYPSLW